MWGLIACHHATPRRIAASTCAAVELFGQIFSLQIEAKEQAARTARMRPGSREAHDRLIASMAPERDDLRQPRRASPTCCGSWSPATGSASGPSKGFIGVGTTPPAEAMPELVRLLGEKSAHEPYATDALCRACCRRAAAYAADASGVLADAVLARRRATTCCSSGREVVRTVTWGGNPNKPVEARGDGARIGPRKSFDAWRETVRGQSMPWRPAELQIAEALRISLLEVILRRADIVDRERRAAQESQAILIAELNHRVKNILALIRSLVRQSRQDARTIDGFADDLEHRIRALALAHDQLTQTRMARRAAPRGCSRPRPGPGPIAPSACPDGPARHARFARLPGAGAGVPRDDDQCGQIRRAQP